MFIVSHMPLTRQGAICVIRQIQVEIDDDDPNSSSTGKQEIHDQHVLNSIQSVVNESGSALEKFEQIREILSKRVRK